MCGSRKIFVATFMSLLALVYCDMQFFQRIGTERNVMEVDPEETAVLTRLKVEETELGTVYSYRCTVGRRVSDNWTYRTNRGSRWRNVASVEEKIHTEDNTSDLISFVDIVFSVSSKIVDCYIYEGRIGSASIGIIINAVNTTAFAYNAEFDTY